MECDASTRDPETPADSPRGLEHTESKQSRRAIRLAAVALERYGIGDAGIELLRLGFMQVFRMVSPSRGQFVLRMYNVPNVSGKAPRDPQSFTDTGLRSPEVLRSQLLWLRELGRETDLIVPEPIPARGGLLLGYVAFEELTPRRELLRRVWKRGRDTYHPDRPGRHYMLLRWVPGIQKTSDIATEDLSLAGAYAARLHRYAEKHPFPEEHPLPKWDWNWPFGDSKTIWTRGEDFYSEREMNIFEAAAHRVREDLRTRGEDRHVFGVVHRDLKLENFVFQGGDVGTIDFDMCGRGYYLFDLYMMLTSLGIHNRDRYEPLRDALLKGYEHERPLPAGYDLHLKTFAAMQTVAAVNRQLALLGSTARGFRGPAFFSNAVNRLERTLEDE
jgi:Ser/Thr protein kinase RdoA (MazF antagonist)